MNLIEKWCNPKDAYSCKSIQNRTEYLLHKDKVLSGDNCNNNCWPKDMFICYNDGINPPSQKITDKVIWEKIKQVIPDTFSIVDDPKKCDVINIGKTWCDSNWNCGTIKSWDDYLTHKNDKISDNCDDCYPKGFWCDKNRYMCNKVNNRDDYLTNKDSFSTDCNDCYPKDKNWCMNDFSDCKTIDNYNMWENVDKNSGNLVNDCESCFPQGLYYCDSNKACNEILTQGEYKNAKKPFYDSKNTCIENCGIKSGSKILFWIIPIISLIIIGLVIFLVLSMGKKSKI